MSEFWVWTGPGEVDETAAREGCRAARPAADSSACLPALYAVLRCLPADMEVDEEAREELLTRYRAHGRKGGAADQARPAAARRSPLQPATCPKHVRYLKWTRCSCCLQEVKGAEGVEGRHFNYFAFEGGSGQLRWMHEVRSPPRMPCPAPTSQCRKAPAGASYAELPVSNIHPVLPATARLPCPAHRPRTSTATWASCRTSWCCSTPTT